MRNQPKGRISHAVYKPVTVNRPGGLAVLPPSGAALLPCRLSTGSCFDRQANNLSRLAKPGSTADGTPSILKLNARTHLAGLLSIAFIVMQRHFILE